MQKYYYIMFTNSIGVMKLTKEGHQNIKKQKTFDAYKEINVFSYLILSRIIYFIKLFVVLPIILIVAIIHWINGVFNYYIEKVTIGIVDKLCWLFNID